jgi:uncharacterized protein YlaI
MIEKAIRSRRGFEDSNTQCAWCGHKHDVNVLRKVFERSGNKTTMYTTCDDCNKRVLLHRHKLGHFSFYKYVDHKKQRKIAAGWVQQKFYAPIDYSIVK